MKSTCVLLSKATVGGLQTRRDYRIRCGGRHQEPELKRQVPGRCLLGKRHESAGCASPLPGASCPAAQRASCSDWCCCAILALLLSCAGVGGFAATPTPNPNPTEPHTPPNTTIAPCFFVTSSVKAAVLVLIVLVPSRAAPVHSAYVLVREGAPTQLARLDVGVALAVGATLLVLGVGW